MLVGNGNQLSTDATQHEAGERDAHTSRVRAYESYKPSGVAWLGDVPVHWEVVQLGRMGIFSKGSGGTKEDEVPDGVPCVRYGDLYTTHKFFISRTRSYVSPAKAGTYTPINRGDILFPTSGETIEEIGKSAVNLMHTQVLCGGDLIVFRPTIPIEPKLAGYALDCPAAQTQKSLMGRGITIMHIYSGQLKYLWLSLPPLPEQRAIVRYLDYVDRRIRRYVDAKRKLIALLEEERQAIVNQAVTRGLDPDVRLKPSGVEWLGDVPAHWEVRRAKFFYREADERSTTGAEELMSVSHKTGVTPRKKTVTMFLAESNMGYKLCRPSDIVINTMWAYMAALGVARQNGLVSPSYGVYRPLNLECLNHDYIDSLLRTEAYRANYLIRSTGITSSRLRLYPESFLDIPLLCPPSTEQGAIIEYLDKTTAAIDAAIARARRQIELLQEYRTRLIADVVTGKLDVREAAVHLPDEGDAEEPIEETSPLADGMGDDVHDADEAAEKTAVESEAPV